MKKVIFGMGVLFLAATGIAAAQQGLPKGAVGYVGGEGSGVQRTSGAYFDYDADYGGLIGHYFFDEQLSFGVMESTGSVKYDETRYNYQCDAKGTSLLGAFHPTRMNILTGQGFGTSIGFVARSEDFDCKSDFGVYDTTNVDTQELQLGLTAGIGKGRSFSFLYYSDTRDVFDDREIEFMANQAIAHKIVVSVGFRFDKTAVKANGDFTDRELFGIQLMRYFD